MNFKIGDLVSVNEEYFGLKPGNIYEISWVGLWHITLKNYEGTHYPAHYFKLVRSKGYFIPTCRKLLQ